MDVYRAIRTLYDEKRRLDKLIESLEALQARGDASPAEQSPARRGRKRMSAEERQQVSERMKKYWAARRQQPLEMRAPEPQAAAATATDPAS